MPDHASIRQQRRGPAASSASASLIDPQTDEELLLSSVIDYAIFRLDPQGRVASWNRGAERIKGYTAEEIIGQHFSIFYPRDVVASGKCEFELEVAAEQGRFEDEGWRLRKDGSRFWANVVITALRDRTGTLRGYAKVTRDLTERRAAEQALLEARERSERANRAKTDFLSRISHELRTPLAAIIGFAELLQLSEHTPSQAARIAAIIRSGDHLVNLINEILEISRIEAGTLSVASEAVRVDSVINDAVEILTPLAASKKVSISAEPADELLARADEHRLRQVVVNLLSNAVKFNRPGGSVVCKAAATNEGIEVCVTDTGMGIAAAHLDLIFEPFERLDADHAGIEGTGLGLALVRSLVDAMRGQLRVTSELGEGTTFTVVLPVADAAAPSAGAAAAPPQRPAPAVSRSGPATILYIEDTPDNVELVRQTMELRNDVRLIVATDGEGGIAAAQEHRPALILLDVHLPDITGDVVLSRLKGDPATAGIPVVVLSADATDAQRERLMSLGALKYLVKPVRAHALMELGDLAARR